MTTEEKLSYLNREIEAAKFDDFLIVFSKDGVVYQKYSNKLSAVGMCKLVEEGIKESWNEKDNKPSTGFRFSDN